MSKAAPFNVFSTFFLFFFLTRCVRCLSMCPNSIICWPLPLAAKIKGKKKTGTYRKKIRFPTKVVRYGRAKKQHRQTTSYVLRSRFSHEIFYNILAKG